MPDVFDGKPDARQSADSDLATSRFRPRYRALEPDEKSLHDSIKDAASNLESLFERVSGVRSASGHAPRPREAALAMTKLEEAVMWAIKGLAA